MTRIQIIVGTVMGTSEGIAEHIKTTLDDDYSIEVNTEANADDLTRDQEELLLFCVSNTGNGDLPDNIAPLYAQLRNEFPNIAYRKYALINLGDSSYPTYGEAGVALNEALVDIGASPISEPLLIDSSIERYPQKMALDWFKEILNTL